MLWSRDMVQKVKMRDCPNKSGSIGIYGFTWRLSYRIWLDCCIATLVTFIKQGLLSLIFSSWVEHTIPNNQVFHKRPYDMKHVLKYLMFTYDYFNTPKFCNVKKLYFDIHQMDILTFARRSLLIPNPDHFIQTQTYIAFPPLNPADIPRE